MATIRRFWLARQEVSRVMFVALIVVLLRSVLLLWHGRVLAEEGTVYLQQAWTASPLMTLTMVHQGYYSLLMNLLALMSARWIPLEWMGHTMTLAADLILLLTTYLAVECEAFSGSWGRWFAAGVCVLTPSIEVWDTAEDCQFVLALAVAIVCLSLAERRRIVRTGTLLIAALSGPVSCVFTPMFLYRAYRQRNFWSRLQAGVMLLGCSVQGAVLLGSIRAGTRGLANGNKDAWFGPVIVLKIFSVAFFSRLGAFAAQRMVVPHPNLIVCLVFWVLFVGFTLLFVRMGFLGGEAGLLCLAMALTSLIFNYQGIAEPVRVILIGAFRYFFTGYALFLLVLVAAYTRLQRTGSARQLKMALAFVLLTLTTGAIDAVGYWSRAQLYQPIWREEVEAWRQDPTKPIRVTPAHWGDTVHIRPR